MRSRILLLTVAIALLAGCKPSDPNKNAGDKPSQRPPDPAIVAKLQEIVAVRQQIAKDQQMIAGAGLGNDNGMAEIALIEARKELARERGQSELVITELRNIVAAQQKQLKIVEERAVDRTPRAEVDRRRVALLEAELQLQRELVAAKGK